MKAKNNYKPFVYITTNLINGKQYVGSHIGTNKNYLGSGIYLKAAKKKYNKNNFKREILKYCETVNEARLLEEIYIKKHNTLYPNGYNLSPTGGNGLFGCHSNETKEKLRQINKGKKLSLETKNKLSISHTGKKLSNDHKNNISKGLQNRIYKKGIILTEEHKNNISKGLTGRVFSEEHRKKLGIASRNRIVSDETKKKQSISRKGKAPSNKGLKMSIEQREKLKEAWRQRKIKKLNNHD